MLYGAEKRTLKIEEKRRIGAFAMWVWRRLINICCRDMVSNEDVLKRIKEESNILNTVVNKKINWLEKPVYWLQFIGTVLGVSLLELYEKKMQWRGW